MKIEPYSESIDPNILLDIRAQMKVFEEPDEIRRDNLSFESYMESLDETEPTRDFLIAKDEKGNIVGWAGLFRGSEFPNGVAIFVLPQFLSSSLPSQLLDRIEKLAETQELTNLRLYAHARFAALHEALHERGAQSRIGEYTLILKAPELLPALTTPSGIILKSNTSTENFTMYAETVNAAFNEYPNWQVVSEEELGELDQDLYKSGYSESIRFYAYAGQQQVGVIHAAAQKPDQAERKGLIIRLGIIPSHQRQGIGTALLERAIRWLLEKDCSEIMLDVIAENEDAITIYKKWGFIEVKDRRMLIYTLRPSEE